MWVGYVEFLGFLFVPGLAIAELLDLKLSSFFENLAVILGLGFSVDALFLMLSTSGLNLFGTRLLGVHVETVQWSILLWLGVFGLGLMLRRRVPFYVKPGRADGGVLVLTGAQALLVMIHFVKFPIFPEFSSIDFTQHVMIAGDLASGAITSLPGGILYYAVHGFLAALQSLAGGLPLVVDQRAMGILVALSPVMLYGAFRGLSLSVRACLFATFVYVAGGFIWFGSVFDAGLYSNFYGVLSVFFMLIAASMALRSPRSVAPWVVYALSVGNAYFSHYSTLTIFIPLIALPILDVFLTGRIRIASVAVAAIPTVPAVFFLALQPSLVGLLTGFVTSAGAGNISGSTALSSLFAWFPFLQYTIIEIVSDSAALFILVASALGVYFTLKSRASVLWLPLVWLATLAVVAPFSGAAWRFAYVGLVPLVALAAVGLDSVIPIPPPAGTVRRRKGGGSWVARRGPILACVLLLLMVAGSWGTTIAGDAVSNPGQVGRAQYQVYYSMAWFDSNTPAGSRLVSVTDSDYLYLGFLTGRTAAYVPLVSPGALLSQLGGQSNVYVAVTQIVSLPASEASQTAQTLAQYASSPSFKLVYSNADVRIYSMVNST